MGMGSFGSSLGLCPLEFPQAEGYITDRLTESINHKGVFRTAPAKPGLLKKNTDPIC